MGPPDGEEEPCWPHTRALGPTLLEGLQGDGGVLDGHNHAAMVQIQDVVLLLEHLQGSGRHPEEGRTLFRLGGRSLGAELSTCKLGVSAEASSLSQGWSEGSPCPQAIPMPSHSSQA